LKGDVSDDYYFVRRMMVGWLGIAFIASLLYQGAQPAHALWLTIPLALLSAVTIEKIITPVQDRFFDIPAWGPYVHGIAVVAMLAITGINMVIVARMIMSTSPSELPALDGNQRVRLLFILPAALLLVITFFLVGSIWGARASWHGLGIGTLIFFGLFSLGSGWRAAVVNADDPRELWQVQPVTRNLNLLLSTLTFASRRSQGMPYDMEITVVTGNGGPAQDGALAWMLRRYANAQYVTELGPATISPVIIQAKTAPTPKAAADYVGQAFAVYSNWNRGALSWDFLSWLYDRQTHTIPQSAGEVIVWVRSDVYGLASQQSDVAPANPTP
jgi:hypothetical protein